jgi:hypothetical protein
MMMMMKRCVMQKAETKMSGYAEAFGARITSWY